MKTIKFATVMVAFAAVCCTACCKKNVQTDVTPQQETDVIVKQPLGMVLKASAFKMSGDYADNVAVTLDNSGNLVYFPAPTDITSESRPVEIGDGWWLNRQGLGANSVFTKWTFDEYMALPTVPSPAEIKAAVIPGAHVTDFRRLPISASAANQESPTSLLHYLQ